MILLFILAITPILIAKQKIKTFIHKLKLPNHHPFSQNNEEGGFIIDYYFLFDNSHFIITNFMATWISVI